MLVVEQNAISLLSAIAGLSVTLTSTDQPGTIQLTTPFGSVEGSFTAENRTFTLLLETPAGLVDGSFATSIENRLFIDFKTFAGEFRGFGFYDEDELSLGLSTPSGFVTGEFQLKNGRTLNVNLSTPIGDVEGVIETTIEDRLFVELESPFGDVEGFGFYDNETNDVLIALQTPLGPIVGDFEIEDDLLQINIFTTTGEIDGTITLGETSSFVDLTNPLGDFTGNIGLGGLSFAFWMVPFTLMAGTLDSSCETQQLPISNQGSVLTAIP